MKPIPVPVAEFLQCHRVAVAGVSRNPNQPANHIFKRLRQTGHEVAAVNPNSDDIDGEPCYHDLASIPGGVDAVMVVTHPRQSAEVVRQAAALGVRSIWFHRSFGSGSVSEEALAECRCRGIEPIVGGCPMMFAGEVDVAHKCFRWWLGWRGRVPH